MEWDSLTVTMEMMISAHSIPQHGSIVGARINVNRCQSVMAGTHTWMIDPGLITRLDSTDLKVDR